MKTKTIVAIIIGIIAIIVLICLWLSGTFKKWADWINSKVNPNAVATGATSTSKVIPISQMSYTGPSKYPVTTKSTEQDIYNAMVDSGYIAAAGANNPEFATNDPLSQLQSHPYLYTAYPNFFSQT